MGSPHGFLFVAKQVYHVLNPFFSSFLVQLAETKVDMKGKIRPICGRM
jgi:hypothetical protein